MIALPLLLAVAAAGMATPPAAIDPGSWVMPSDYPYKASFERTQGNVAFRLSVDASGKPDACGILTSSGSQELDVTTCELVLARGRFKPALGQDGKPVRSNYSSVVRWTVSD